MPAGDHQAALPAEDAGKSSIEAAGAHRTAPQPPGRACPQDGRPRGPGGAKGLCRLASSSSAMRGRHSPTSLLLLSLKSFFHCIYRTF